MSAHEMEPSYTRSGVHFVVGAPCSCLHERRGGQVAVQRGSHVRRGTSMTSQRKDSEAQVDLRKSDANDLTACAQERCSPDDVPTAHTKIAGPR